MKYEFDFLPVGDSSGDPIVIRYGDETTGNYLLAVDGGRTATANTVTGHINEFYPGYPRCQVTNAFIRRRFAVYCKRAGGISHARGGRHANATPIAPEVCKNEIEGL